MSRALSPPVASLAEAVSRLVGSGQFVAAVDDESAAVARLLGLIEAEPALSGRRVSQEDVGEACRHVLLLTGPVRVPCCVWTVARTLGKYNAAERYAGHAPNGAHGRTLGSFYVGHLQDPVQLLWKLVAANVGVGYERAMSEPNVMLLLGFGRGRGVILRTMRFPARLPSFQDVKERMEQLAAHVVEEDVGAQRMNQVIEGLLLAGEAVAAEEVVVHNALPGGSAEDGDQIPDWADRDGRVYDSEVDSSLSPSSSRNGGDASTRAEAHESPTAVHESLPWRAQRSHRTQPPMAAAAAAAAAAEDPRGGDEGSSSTQAPGGTEAGAAAEDPQGDEDSSWSVVPDGAEAGAAAEDPQGDEDSSWSVVPDGAEAGAAAEDPQGDEDSSWSVVPDGAEAGAAAEDPQRDEDSSWSVVPDGAEAGAEAESALAALLGEDGRPDDVVTFEKLYQTVDTAITQNGMVAMSHKDWNKTENSLLVASMIYGALTR